MKNINFNAIQKDIDDNYLDLTSSIKDVYEFMHELTLKHVANVHPRCMELTDKNPYADMLFAMFEINNIELY